MGSGRTPRRRHRRGPAVVDLWYPGGVRDPAPESCWGTHADTGEPKFLLHTTEGGLGVYAPDPGTGTGRRYYGNTGTWPNYTLARRMGLPKWRIFQHIPAGRSAMGLRNQPGGVQTNRDNVSQVEIAARAAEIGALPAEALDMLAHLLAWEHQVRGVPLRSSVRWVAYPASYGERAAQRLSPAAWDAYAGVLGHEHAPENDHGDPGAFPVDALLSRAHAIVAGDGLDQGGGGDVGLTEQEELDIVNRLLAVLRAQVFSVSPPIRQSNAGQVIGATYNKVGDLQAAIGPVGDGGTVMARLDAVERVLAAMLAELRAGATRPAAQFAVTSTAAAVDVGREGE